MSYTSAALLGNWGWWGAGVEAYSASAKYRAGSEVWPLGQRLACVIQDLWEAINFITDPSIPEPKS